MDRRGQDRHGVARIGTDNFKKSWLGSDEQGRELWGKVRLGEAGPLNFYTRLGREVHGSKWYGSARM